MIGLILAPQIRRPLLRRKYQPSPFPPRRGASQPRRGASQLFPLLPLSLLARLGSLLSTSSPRRFLHPRPMRVYLGPLLSTSSTRRFLHSRKCNQLNPFKIYATHKLKTHRLDTSYEIIQGGRPFDVCCAEFCCLCFCLPICFKCSCPQLLNLARFRFRIHECTNQ